MKTIKKWVAVLLCLATLCPLSLTGFANGEGTAKEEIIYIMTDAEGNVSSINAVEIFGSGENILYGNLSDLKSLNTTDKITEGDSLSSFKTDSERVYVQGTMENVEIPWTVSIRYELDGTYYSAKEIAGKSGKLNIHFDISKNEKASGNFFDDYALQATVTLDTGKCRNIVADCTNMANVGNNKQITYTVLPGNGLHTVISADVTDFEMNAVSINGIKLSLNIEIDDTGLMDKVTEFTDAIAKLSDGAGKLNDGAKELKDGAEQFNEGAATLSNGASELEAGLETLDEGIEKINSGLNTLNGQSKKLTGGSNEVLKALKTIKSSLSSVSASTSELDKLVQGSAEVKDGIAELYAGAVKLQDNISYEAYKEILNDNGLDLDYLSECNDEAITTMKSEIALLNLKIKAQKKLGNDTSELESTVSQLNDLIKLVNGNIAAIGATKTYLDTVSPNLDKLVSGINELKTQYEKLDSGISTLATKVSDMLVSLTKLKSGIDTLVTEYATLDSGISDYTDGVAEIVSGYSQVVTGTKTLLTGSSSLEDGANELYTKTESLVNGATQLYDGTSELAEKTSAFSGSTGDIGSTVSEKIDAILDSLSDDSAVTVSFVDERNTSVSTVQFVIKTEAVETLTETNETEKKVETLTFWQKLLRLFGLY